MQAKKSLSNNWVIRAPGEAERIEAFFSDIAFTTHRHDTYAIGFTLGGVQSFDYRGAARHSQPGCTLVLHPDEQHDGRAGSEIGFRYRAAYVEPAMIQSALGGKPLPFIGGGISTDSRLCKATKRLLADLDHPLELLEYQDAVYDLAIALDMAAGQKQQTAINADYRATSRVQQYIADNLHQNITLDELEAVSGHDRWKLSRDFRTLYGTSPYRYLIMRRLDQARTLLLGGESMSTAAIACDFADQSHMIRHFKKTYGMTPKRWLSTLCC